MTTLGSGTRNHHSPWARSATRSDWQKYLMPGLTITQLKKTDIYYQNVHWLTLDKKLTCQWQNAQADQNIHSLNGLPFPPPEDLSNPGIESGFPALQADSSPSEPPGKPIKKVTEAQTSLKENGHWVQTGWLWHPAGMPDSSCLGNTADRGAWWARVTGSQKRRKWQWLNTNKHNKSHQAPTS